MEHSNRSPLVGIPAYTLNNGIEMPAIGLGCAQLEDYGEQDALIRRAVELGYRLFDTAVNYGNEAEIGSGIRQCGAARESLLVSSKVPGDNRGYDDTLRFYDQSLKAFGLDYLDIYLIHWPSANAERVRGTWRALEKIYEEGRVRVIGLSNFSEKHLDALLPYCNVSPMINQLEFNPYFSIAGLRRYCAENDIVVEGFFPLGGQVAGAKGLRQPPPEIQMLDHPVIADIAKVRGRTPAQVILRWEVQSGAIVIPKTTKRGRLEENIRIFDFALREDEMQRIDSLNFDFRIGPDWDALGD